ncbi:MAG: hypothetical protein PHI86_07245 [Candidatus Omnitrophica bacterium]|nr:hypothetical protein [Candidatus Omnitrophota bacterium]
MNETIDIEPTARELRPVLGAAVIELGYMVKDADGVAVNLTGATHRCLLKRNHRDADNDAVCAFEVEVAAPATGRVTLRLVPAAPPDPYEAPAAGTYYPDYSGTEVQYGYVAAGTYYASHLFVLDGEPHTPLELVLTFGLPVTRAVA